MRGRPRDARRRLDGLAARLLDSTHLEDRLLLSGLLGSLAPVLSAEAAPADSGDHASILGGLFDLGGDIAGPTAAPGSASGLGEGGAIATTGNPPANLLGLIGGVAGLTAPVTDLVDDLGGVVGSVVMPTLGLLGEVGAAVDSVAAPVVPLGGGLVGTIVDPVGQMVGSVDGAVGQPPTSGTPTPPDGAGNPTPPVEQGTAPPDGSPRGGGGSTGPILGPGGTAGQSTGDRPPTSPASPAGGGGTVLASSPSPADANRPSGSLGISSRTDAAPATTTSPGAISTAPGAIAADAHVGPTGTANAPGSGPSGRDGPALVASSAAEGRAGAGEDETRAVGAAGESRADRGAGPGQAPAPGGTETPAGVLAPPIERPIIEGNEPSPHARGAGAADTAVTDAELAEMTADDLPLLELALRQLVEEIEGLGRAVGEQLDELAASPWLLVPAVGSAAYALMRIRQRRRGRRLAVGCVAAWSTELPISLT